VLHRIKIEGYKSFKFLDVTLRPLTVIIGPNTAGKSNFLDALYFLSRAVTSRNLKEAFEGHRGLPLESFYYGDEGFERLLQREVNRCTFEVDVELSDSTVHEINRTVLEKRRGLDARDEKKQVIKERLLRYRLTLEILPVTGHVRVHDEELFALRRDGKGRKKRSSFLEKVGTNSNQRFHLRMEGQAHPTYYQIGLEHTIVSTPFYEPHYPHIVAFRRELEKWRTYYLEPRTLMREEVPVAETLGIGPRGENLAAFLNTLKHTHEPAFENLNLTLQQLLPTKPRIDVELLKEGRVGLRISENGLDFSARLISEGTLRIVGLIAALHPANPSILIGYEEPENGVHPVRLKIIADLMKHAVEQYRKQVIVTTHSPIFPEYFDNEDLFVCSKEASASSIKPLKDYGPLFRRMNIQEALSERILRGDFGG